MKKLILFGDSLLGRFSKNPINRLEKILDYNYDVYNFAAGGWDSSDGLKKANYISSFAPELVIICFGMNDAAPWKRVELDKYDANIRGILEEFRNSRIVFFLPPPINEAKQIGENKRDNETIKNYHDAAKQACIEKGVDNIDLWPILVSMLENGGDYTIEGGVHFNDAGYEKLFEAIKETV